MVTTEIQIITNIFKDLLLNKLENPEKTNKFLSTYTLPKLNKGDIIKKTLNNPITGNEIESVILEAANMKKKPGSKGFITDFYENFRKYLFPMFIKL